MKCLIIALLVLSLSLLVGAGRAEASNPMSDQEKDWKVISVVNRQESTDIFFSGKTFERLDESGIELWARKGASWQLVPAGNTAYVTNMDEVTARWTVQNTYFTGNFLMKLKYDGQESPEMNFCSFAVSIKVGEICTDPFEQTGDDNEMIEVYGDKLHFIAKLVQGRYNINRDDVRLFVKAGAGNPLNVSYERVSAPPNLVAAEIDREPSLLNRLYFFEFGEYKSPDFLLKGMALANLRPIEYQAFLGTEEATEEAGTIGESGSETTVATDEASDLPEASSKAIGHCSLVTDATAAGMGMLILLLGAMLAPLAAVRIRRNKR